MISTGLVFLLGVHRSAQAGLLISVLLKLSFFYYQYLLASGFPETDCP